MRSEVFLVLFSVAFTCFVIQTEARFLNITRILDSLNFSKGVRVQGDCSYNINGDLTDPQPLFLKHNTTQFLLPNSTTGIVEISNGQLFDMYCSNGFVEPLLNKTKITAQCLQGSFHLVNGIVYNFKDFSCQDWPTYTARRTNRTCNGGTVVIEIGFEIDDGNFVKTIEVCHDEINEVNRYAHFQMTPSSQSYQRYVARPLFISGGFYKGKDVNELYTKVKQKLTFDKILGQDTSKYFNSSDIYLARGHLSAKVDHVYAPAQKATFFFVNAAPQWQCFNAGNWESVESSVRKFIANRKIDVECYTGTWGVSTLPDVNGVQQELYLDFDVNNNGLIPVPKIYFRVVVEPATKKGVVLIGVNNPHISVEQILGDYVICDDISDSLTWITWKKNDLLEGFVYACEVQQFRQVVKDLPEFDVNELLI